MVELIEHLTEQIAFLLKSARAFDDGDFSESKRMATTIRVMVHLTRQSHALLDQCGVLKTMRFGDSSAPIDPPNMLGTPGLVAMMVTSNGWQYVPSRAPIRRWVVFDVWWQAPVVQAQGTTLRRRDLVLEVANTDGGAHVGSRVPKYEQNLSR